jgi:hypothetical protein
MKLSQEEIKHKIEQEERIEPDLNNQNIVENLTELVEALLEKTQWYKTIKIDNKQKESERFQDRWRDNEKYTPRFKFKEYPYDPKQVIDLLNQCQEAATQINEKHLRKYDAEQLKPEILQELFIQIFGELKLFSRLAADIEDQDRWRELSEEIWPMVEKETARKSLKKLQKIDREVGLEKEISPGEVGEMFEEEIERLGMDYTVETRKISGCFNMPEESTVVVAEGDNGQRMYSEKEAEMLTIHELFHAVRSYNGFKAGKKSGFPKILGLHTPFYDRAEEGGALYREEKTQVKYPKKEFDYHLRLIAAYKISRSDNYTQEFQTMAEELVELGATPKRAFQLLTRNREFLRHHIYQAGRNDWKQIENKQKMLIGKVNQKWADRFSKEIGGMIQEPEIGPEKLFNFSFNN